MVKGINEDPIITICCLTYNHEEYLAKTLAGFCNQETEYSYEILIHDDCSTDGTIEMLKAFEKENPGRVKVIYEDVNQFSRGVNIAYQIMAKYVRCKYVAVCEGDDWWTDPHKLQKQVSFMEKHPECVLTVHNGSKLDCRSNEEDPINPFSGEGYLSEYDNYMAFMNNPPTASFVVRKDILVDVPEYVISAPVFDDVLRLYAFEKGGIYYFEQMMCCRTYMHEDSWNYLLDQKQELYLNYVIRILQFYDLHDKYTGYKHTELICAVKRKIGKRFKYMYQGELSELLAEKLKELSGVDMGGAK